MDNQTQATEYCVIVRRNVYAGTLGIDGHARWMTRYDVDGDQSYGTEPATWDTVADAMAYIAEIDGRVYATAHGEAGRPEYWVVPLDAVDEVRGCHDDMGLYAWPEAAVADVGCTNPRDGETCGECAECLEWMSRQDDATLEAARVTE
jgi:hypothetical protein